MTKQMSGQRSKVNALISSQSGTISAYMSTLINRDMSLLICSYSNADGEVNTMFSPVRSMAGDTVAIRMYFFDEWDFEYDWDIFYIVLV